MIKVTSNLLLKRAGFSRRRHAGCDTRNGGDGVSRVGYRRRARARFVGDLLALWAFDDPRHPRYLIDGMEGGMTPVGTFEREVGAVTYRDGVLLIATKEYVEAHGK